jgi:aspartyl-tRNA(Asn)/glutamyl-tRNA(Gln) amidotransferase subunit A
VAPLLALTAADAATEIRARRLSPVELIDAVLARIEAVEERVHAFVELDPEGAVAAARTAETEIARGVYRGPLHGIPLAVKDIYDVDGLSTGAGTPAFPRARASRTSTAVARLIEAGCIVVGKTHTHELALGVMTPQTRNPWNAEHSAGGSSGGSAAAVAAGESLVALGSDTGGSIRGPASVCGVVGLKPTYGRISRFGIVANSWSLDTAGPLTRSVRDAALILNALAGSDPRDPATVDVPVPDYTEGIDSGVAGLTVGVPSNYYFDRIDPDVAAAVSSAIETFRAAGADIRTVEVPFSDYYDATIRGIQLPEISAYHAELLRDRGSLLTEQMRLTLTAATLLPARIYVRAQQAREVIKQAWRELFTDIDALVTPTHPAAAPRLQDMTYRWPDGFEEAHWRTYSRLTLPANLTGLPAISVPCGLTRAALPCGLQVIGRPFDEATVLRIAMVHEQATPTRAPEIETESPTVAGRVAQ